MSDATYIDPSILKECSSRTVECPHQQQEACPIVILGSNLRNPLLSGYEVLTSPITTNALEALASSETNYPKPCFELISYLKGAAINAIIEMSKQYGNIAFPSDLIKLNKASLLEIKELGYAIKTVSVLIEDDDLEKDFVDRFGGIFWQDKIPSSPSVAYTCHGTNHGTREGDYLPLQIAWPKSNNKTDLILEFESSIPVGSYGQIRITTQSSSDLYYVLKPALIDDSIETTTLAYEALNSTLPQPFAGYIGIDLDGYPFIAIPETGKNKSWRDFDLEAASLFNSACMLIALGGIKNSYQKSALLAEEMAASCNLPALERILLELSSYFRNLT